MDGSFYSRYLPYGCSQGQFPKSPLERASLRHRTTGKSRLSNLRYFENPSARRPPSDFSVPANRRDLVTELVRILGRVHRSPQERNGR